jgi:hemerythrin-like domain-containing protein
MANATPSTSSTSSRSSGASRAKPKSGSREGRRTARQKSKPQDALQLLREDHREVQQWFKAFEKTDDDAEKQRLAAAICSALVVHAQIEEEIFYPAAYDALEDNDLLDEAEVEHQSAKQLIAEIAAMRVGEALFDAKVKVLGEYVNHHIREEENELFPECRDSDMDLKALGTAMQARKQELMGAKE